MSGKFLWYIQKQFQDRFFDVECEININNVELLVELADFVRALGFPVPRALQLAFAQVTSAQVLLWLQELTSNLDGAAHVVYLFQRRLNPAVSLARKARVAEMFSSVCASPVTHDDPAPETTGRYNFRPRTAQQNQGLSLCEAWHGLNSDCPTSPKHNCTNERLRQGQFAETFVAQSSIAGGGRGVFAKKTIVAGQFLAEYTGQVLVF